MGFLNNFFGRAEAIKEEIGNKNSINNDFNFSQNESTAKNPITVFTPKSYQDVEKIILVMRQGKTVVVHLTQVKTDTAIRILDMLSGAIFALGGGVYEMEQNIFMFSKNGVEVEQ